MPSLLVHQLQENSCPALDSTHISLQIHDGLLVLQHTQAEEHLFFFFKLHLSCFKTSMFQRYLRDAHTVRFLVPLLFTELPAFNPQQACPDNSQSFIPGGKGDRVSHLPGAHHSWCDSRREEGGKTGCFCFSPLCVWSRLALGFRSCRISLKISWLESLARHYPVNTAAFGLI